MSDEKKTDAAILEAQNVREQLKQGKEDENNTGHKLMSQITRRQFLKKAGLGATGFAALLSPVSALSIRDDVFSVQTSNDSGATLTEGLFVDNNQNVEISNGDLKLSSNSISNVSQINGKDASTLGGTRGGEIISYSQTEIQDNIDADIDYIINTPLLLGAVVRSGEAMDAISSSSVAMNSIASNSNAMDSVMSSSIALQKFWAETGSGDVTYLGGYINLNPISYNTHSGVETAQALSLDEKSTLSINFSADLSADSDANTGDAYVALYVGDTEAATWGTNTKNNLSKAERTVDISSFSGDNKIEFRAVRTGSGPVESFNINADFYHLQLT